MTKNIYCFSGLGADDRLFSKLSLQPFVLQHIPWLSPLPDETLPQYAIRLSHPIKEEQPVLLGVSFGGMLAIEAAKHFKTPYTIIVSSIPSALQFPFYYQWVYRLQLIKALPDALFTTPNPFMHYLFGTESAEDKMLLNNYLKNADPPYIRWALKAIMNWKNTALPPGLVHLHGTRDSVIPLPKSADYKIEKGGHLMVYNRADEISRILLRILGNKAF